MLSSTISGQASCFFRKCTVNSFYKKIRDTQCVSQEFLSSSFMMCNALEGTLCWIRAGPSALPWGGGFIFSIYFSRNGQLSVFLFLWRNFASCHPLPPHPQGNSMCKNCLKSASETELLYWICQELLFIWTSFYILLCYATGVSMASMTELSFSGKGFISAMTANVAFTYSNIYSKKAMVCLTLF